MKDSPFDIGACVSGFLREGEAVAVGVSGGPDSMALCHVLAQQARGDVHVISVDHGLRAEAAAEAAQVGRWVKDWPHVIHQVLIRAVSGDDKTRIQEQARHDRYAMMADYCAAHNIGKLFAGHHQDDQAETFLFRLAKGSGLDGLAAMAPVYDYSARLQIIRPFLDVPKAALVSYCERDSIPYVSDPSNGDEQFARARLRGAREVLENEGLSAKRLSVTAARLARARQALEIYSDQAFGKATINNEAARIVFDYDVLREEPEEIRLRVLLRAMDLIHPDRGYGPRMEKAEDLAHRIFGDDGFKKASLGGCLFTLDRKQKRISIESEHKKPT